MEIEVLFFSKSKYESKVLTFDYRWTYAGQDQANRKNRDHLGFPDFFEQPDVVGVVVVDEINSAILRSLGQGGVINDHLKPRPSSGHASRFIAGTFPEICGHWRGNVYIRPRIFLPQKIRHQRTARLWIFGDQPDDIFNQHQSLAQPEIQIMDLVESINHASNLIFLTLSIQRFAPVLRKSGWSNTLQAGWVLDRKLWNYHGLGLHRMFHDTRRFLSLCPQCVWIVWKKSRLQSCDNQKYS